MADTRMGSDEGKQMRFDRPPPEPLASAIGFLLAWNGQRIGHVFDEELASLGLRKQHFGVLTLLAAEPGISQQALVERSMIDPSSMVALLDQLEDQGIVERRPNPVDRRKHAVELTALGRQTLGRARRSAARTAERVLKPLDEDERDELQRLLRKLAGVEGDD
jgi:DNA-binding MarR family transcriptional regulator